MKLYPGVYYYTDPATNELYIYNLDYNYTLSKWNSKEDLYVK